MAFKIFLVCFLVNLLVSNSMAGYYGGGGGRGGGGCCGGGGGGGGGGGSSINAAVISRHTFQINDVASSAQSADLPTIIVNGGSTPLKLQLGSSSSDIQIESSHSNSKPQVKYSSSVDGALILNHHSKKPIIQNIYETIIPKRYVVQKVLPVKEYIKTIVSQEKGSKEKTTTSAPEEEGGEYGMYPPHMFYRK